MMRDYQSKMMTNYNLDQKKKKNEKNGFYNFPHLIMIILNLDVDIDNNWIKNKKKNQ